MNKDYQVKTYNAIAQAGLDRFTDQFKINQTDDPDAYLIRSVNLNEQELPQNLKVIARAGAGYNNVPLDRATKQGVAVFNTPGSNANAVKEAVIAMMIESARNLFAVADFAQHNIDADISLMKKKDPRFKGTELLNKKVAVIGLGHVGSLVANAANDLGMEVTGYDPYLSANAAWQLSNEINRADSIQKAVADADFVTVHVPKNKETTGLIDKNIISKMKKGAHLFNYSRLGIVNNDDAVAGLDKGILSTYITDFGDPVLVGRDDVIFTPHIGGSTIEAESNGAIRGANIIMRFLTTGNIKGSVNLPEVQAAFNAPYRLTLIHENVPNMVGQMTTLLANHDLNIESMNNGSRDKVAYTLIDLDQEPSTDLLNQIKQIKAMYRVRLIKH